jgi:probable rRNA maturation factor
MEPPSTRLISVLNQTGRRLPTSIVRRAVSYALFAHAAIDREVCVLLTTDEDVRELNHRFRNIDETTDVLSFPAGDFPDGPLGDIAISVPYARRQAAARKVSLAQELAYLAVHGALHLVGYDDDTDEDRGQMVAEMNRIAVMAELKPDENWSSLLHSEDPS